MSNNVFANGREVSCKKADGKSICCMPDVCFTPPDKVPPTPLGVPVPYPNTGMAKDTTSGSKKVKISDQEVLLKNKSYFKKTTGNEAGAAQKKGILTSKNTGKAYFAAWSMDVKVEGENVVRHLDLTTHNHGSNPNTAPWPYADRIAMAEGLAACDKEIVAVETACEKDEDGNVHCPSPNGATYTDDKGNEEWAKRIQKDDCGKAARCLLSTYKKTGEDKRSCCPPQTPHHLIPQASFFKGSNSTGPRLSGCGSYNKDTAPCVCAEGGKGSATHGLFHSEQADACSKVPGEEYNFGKALDIAAENMEEIFPDSNCRPGCIKAQLRRGGHKGINNDTKLQKKVQKPREKAGALAKFKKALAMITKGGTGGR